MRKPQEATMSYGFEMPSETSTAATNPFTFTTFAAQVGPAPNPEHSTERKWHSNGNGGSALSDVVLDSAIAGGSAAFAIFIAVPGLPNLTLAWAAFVAFGVTFLGSLAAARRRLP